MSFTIVIQYLIVTALTCYCIGKVVRKYLCNSGSNTCKACQQCSSQCQTQSTEKPIIWNQPFNGLRKVGQDGGAD